MLIYTINDLRKIACIQRIVTAVKNDGSELKGTLTKITSESICVKEKQSGIETNIPNTLIQSLIFDDEAGRRYDMLNRLKNMKNKLDRYANDSSITMYEIFRDRLEDFSDKCDNPVLAEYLTKEKEHKTGGYSRNPKELDYIYGDFLKNTKKSFIDDPSAALIEAMLLMRMRRMDEAFFCVLREIERAEREDVFLMSACLGIQSRNSMAALYWLNRYFELAGAERPVSQALWWYYMRMTGKYSVYDYAVPTLRNLAGADPAAALESLIYLLVSCNHAGAAANLLEYTAYNPSSETVNNFIDTFSCFLVTDEDNNYRRFLRCINEIIENKYIRLYKDSEDINGYIYDYIPDKEFGFIIGFDMAMYYFRAESIKSPNLKSNIERNICSASHVKDESLVLATFKRNRASKVSFNANDIV